MGSSPRTKSEYKKKILELQAEYELLKRNAKLHPSSLGGDTWESRAASVKAEIARLKAKMVDAPKD